VVLGKADKIEAFTKIYCLIGGTGNMKRNDFNRTSGSPYRSVIRNEGSCSNGPVLVVENCGGRSFVLLI
jgi:hypothetical protein